MDLIENPDFNSIKLETNMKELNACLDAKVEEDSLLAQVNMQIESTDVDGNIVVSNYSPEITGDIDYTPTSNVNEYQGAKYKLDINNILLKLFDEVDKVVVDDDTITTEELNTYFADTDLHLKITFSGVADGTEVYVPDLGYPLKYNKKQ